MLTPLVVLLILPVKVLDSAVNEWISELFIPQRSIAGIFDSSPVGLRYNRGFPRGIWGTNLAPDLGAYDEVGKKFLVNGFFWNMAKEWLASEANWHQPQAAFDTFRKRVFNYMCAGGSWGCCTAGPRDISCRSPPQSMRDVVFILIDPTENMPVLFLFWWCMHSWVTLRQLNEKRDSVLANELKRNLLNFCPSPCRAKPCRYVPAVDVPNICHVVGPFEDDYECVCREDFVWDQETRTCKAVNPCFARANTHCSAVGTLVCVALDMQHAKCICKPEYTGKDCAHLRNACLTRSNESEPSGNTNCGVAKGNICNPVLGTDSYKCTCVTGWAPSPHLPYDNCALFNDPCAGETLAERNSAAGEAKKGKVTPKINAGIHCHNGGYCINSADFSRAACLCPTTLWGDQAYTGIYCETLRGVWSSWTETTDCRGRSCGISRYRWRRRQCVNESIFVEHPGDSSKQKPSPCLGISEEILPCDEALPCATLRLTGLFRKEIFHYSLLYILLIIVAVELLITWPLGKACESCIVPLVLRKIDRSKASRMQKFGAQPQPVSQDETSLCDKKLAVQETEMGEQGIMQERMSIANEDYPNGGEDGERTAMNLTEICSDDRKDIPISMEKDVNCGTGGEDILLEPLRRNNIRRILENWRSTRRRNARGRGSPPQSRGLLLWKRLKCRLIFSKESMSRSQEEVAPPGRWSETPVVRPSLGAKAEIFPSFEKTIENGKTEAEVVAEEDAPNTDFPRASQKLVTRAINHPEGEGRKSFIIKKEEATGAVVTLNGAQKTSTASVLSQTQATRKHCPDPAEDQPHGPLETDSVVQEPHRPMTELIGKSKETAVESPVDVSVIEAEKLEENVPSRHLKRPLDPTFTRPSEKFPLSSLNTSDQVPLKEPEPSSDDSWTAKASRKFRDLKPPSTMGMLAISPPAYQFPDDMPPGEHVGGSRRHSRKVSYKASVESPEIVEPPKLSFKKEYARIASIHSTSFESPDFPVEVLKKEGDNLERSIPHLSDLKHASMHDEMSSHRQPHISNRLSSTRRRIHHSGLDYEEDKEKEDGGREFLPPKATALKEQVTKVSTADDEQIQPESVERPQNRSNSLDVEF